MVSAVYVDTYVPGLHPKKQKKEKARHTLRVPHTHSTRATSKNKKRTERPAHAHGATHAQRDKGGVAAVKWIESIMIRRPFGSIDPNSIRETELHTEFRQT